MFQQDTRTLGRSSKIELLPIAVLSFFVLAAVHLAATNRFDLPLLVGDKTEAMFDLWSLQHFCAGILLGSRLTRSKFLHVATWEKLAVVAFLLALCWETTELAMEAGFFGQVVEYWKAGFEHWSNRLLGDPFIVTSGALMARRFPRLWKIVLLPATAWLLINVISPNSMYIQHLLFG